MTPVFLWGCNIFYFFKDPYGSIEMSTTIKIYQLNKNRDQRCMVLVKFCDYFH